METLKAKASKTKSCEFMAYSCKGGLPSFEKGHCFPHISNLGEKSLNVSYRRDIGRMGEDASGEGVLYFVTRDSPPFCGRFCTKVGTYCMFAKFSFSTGTQLQASVYISQKTRPIRGILQLHLEYDNHTTNFQIKCE